ncbi:RNA-directed DNA polymerase, eukaryota, reverse transcriptase zinc-binding domain protein [Tanacetum coccineum]
MDVRAADGGVTTREGGVTEGAAVRETVGTVVGRIVAANAAAAIIVKNIEAIDASFDISFMRKVVDGGSTLFWKDPWSGVGSCLMDIFPRLYALDSCKDCLVKDRWKFENGVWCGNWNWRFPPRGRAINEVSDLVSLIGNLILSAEGKYNVKTLSSRIQLISLSDHIIGECHRRNSWIPRKVNIFVWRASLNRLPTRANLASRHITLASSDCPFCDIKVEQVVHCLIRCPRVIPIWRKIWSWWSLATPISFPSFSITDIAMGNIGSGGCMHMRKVLNGVFQIALWVIWNWRNRVIYASGDLIAKTIEDDVFPAIQRVSNSWIAARLSTTKPANWNN